MIDTVKVEDIMKGVRDGRSIGIVGIGFLGMLREKVRNALIISSLPIKQSVVVAGRRSYETG